MLHRSHSTARSPSSRAQVVASVARTPWHSLLVVRSSSSTIPVPRSTVPPSTVVADRAALRTTSSPRSRLPVEPRWRTPRTSPAGRAESVRARRSTPRVARHRRQQRRHPARRGVPQARRGAAACGDRRTLFGTLWVTRRMAHLRERGYGRVVNTTSVAGYLGNFGQANYGAAKAGHRPHQGAGDRGCAAMTSRSTPSLRSAHADDGTTARRQRRASPPRSRGQCRRPARPSPVPGHRRGVPGRRWEGGVSSSARPKGCSTPA